ncbi:hypothetical protein BD310DRAFT_1002584, partial [Dichomitus squalens]
FCSYSSLSRQLCHRFIATGSKVLGWVPNLPFHIHHLMVRRSRILEILTFLPHSQASAPWFSIGVAFGRVHYLLTEFVSVWFPNSPLGRFRIALLTNPLSTWFRLRNSWSVWSDAGTEAQYLVWRKEWGRKRLGSR